jgi:hypothetical protein
VALAVRVEEVADWLRAVFVGLTVACESETLAMFGIARASWDDAGGSDHRIHRRNQDRSRPQCVLKYYEKGTKGVDSAFWHEARIQSISG